MIILWAVNGHEPKGRGAQKPQPCEDASEIIAGCREACIDGVPGGMGKEIPAHPVIGLQVSNYRLDRRAATQLALDGVGDIIFPPGDIQQESDG